jgi:hypothetical protein
MRKSTLAARTDSTATSGVQGVYNLACEEHEGESDIHAAVVAVEEAGFAHPDRFVARDFAPGAIAVVVGLFLMALFFYARERAR